MIVTEVDPLRALEAVMDGFRVMPMAEAATRRRHLLTVTGDTRRDRRRALRADEGRGHRRQQRPLQRRDRHPGAERAGRDKRRSPGRSSSSTDSRTAARSYLLAEGRLVNLAAAEGHPAAVMDMSFANQALSAEWVCKHHAELRNQVYTVPAELDAEVARLKLEAMGVALDTLTSEQAAYLSSWDEGT